MTSFFCNQQYPFELNSETCPTFYNNIITWWAFMQDKKVYVQANWPFSRKTKPRDKMFHANAVGVVESSTFHRKSGRYICNKTSLQCPQLPPSMLLLPLQLHRLHEHQPILLRRSLCYPWTLQTMLPLWLTLITMHDHPFPCLHIW